MKNFKTSIVASISPTSFEALALSGDVERAFQLAKEEGFDAVEIAVRDPSLVKAGDILELAESAGLAIAAIGTGQAYLEEGLSLTSPDEHVRRSALDRMRRQVDLSVQLGARVIVGLIRGTVKSRDEVEEALDLLGLSMFEIGAYAQEVGAPGLLIEPINRYETRLINSVGEGVEFLEKLSDLPVRLLADVFHMNIEDTDMAGAIKAAGDKIGHVHLADSNRHAPGRGHIDFSFILQALEESGYSGYLSCEILPEPSPEEALRLAAAFFRDLSGGGNR